ncbi:MAG TPA: MFS transporter [Anaerolineaceae bacterium]
MNISIRFKKTFTALKYPNYRLWFIGQIVSLFGTWMQNTAQGYLIFELTGSSLYLGYAAIASGIPTWIFTLFGGVIADRISRRKLLMITQTVMMVLAFILAFLTFTHQVQPWHILVLAFLLGTTTAFDTPARQALTSELVDREDLTNAIAVNAAMFNSASAVGPAVAGVTYAALGPGWCFALNGVTFIAVIIALGLMRFKQGVESPSGSRSNLLRSLLDGLTYITHHRIILGLILVVGSLGFFGMSFNTLLPAWAVKILGGDSVTVGFMQGSRGFGALSAALFIASLGRIKYRGKLLSIGTFLFPVALLAMTAVRWLPLSLLLLYLMGFGSMMVMNLANSLVQTSVPDQLRGRVMSIYSLFLFGLMPIGGMVYGALASQFTEPITGVGGGIAYLAIATLVFAFAPKVRKLE